MQPRRPIDTIRDSILPLFYPDPSSGSGVESESVPSHPMSAPCKTDVHHLFIHDNNGYISMQSHDLTKEIAVEIRQRLMCRPVAGSLLLGNKSNYPNTPIRSLDLEGCKLTKTLLDIIFEGIKECRSLECLNLSGNRLLRNEIYAIVDWFTLSPMSFSHITDLSFSGSLKFTPESIRDFLLALCDNCSALKTLQLNDCMLSDDHTEHFRRFLSIVSTRNIPLQELHLKNNDIAAKGCRRLLDARDIFLPQLKILVQDNPAPESLISRLSCPTIYMHANLNIPTVPMVPEYTGIQTKDSDLVFSNEVSSYIDQQDCLFQNELRLGLLSFIKQTLGDDTLDPLDEKTTPELCMHCISAIKLHVGNYSSNGPSKEIEELMKLKDTLEKSGLSFNGVSLTMESHAAEALSVAIHLIQSLLQIITGQVVLE